VLPAGYTDAAKAAAEHRIVPGYRLADEQRTLLPTP
jgi:hypothetical protein